LGMDPVELRRKNLIQPDEFPYQTPVALAYDSGNYPALFDKIEELSGYENLRSEQAAAREDGRIVGVGFASGSGAGGPAPSAVAVGLGAAIGLYGSGLLRVHPTGKVVAMTGSHSHGQGHETTFAQIVADELGVPIEDVEIVHGDTDRTPYGVGTYGSRSAAIGGSALVKSAEKIREKCKARAAHLLEASPDDMVYDQDTGMVSVKGSPDSAKAFAELAFALTTADNMPEGMEPGLEAGAFYDPVNFTFPSSAHAALVEIEPDTGEVEVQIYAAVDDVGTVINHLTLDGQVHGGVVQGVGQAILERMVYDPDSGQPASGSLMDYAMPRASDVCSIEVESHPVPTATNPLGVKGAGEAGCVGALPAVMNGIIDALSPHGVGHIDMPASPERIWRAIREAATAE